MSARARRSRGVLARVARGDPRVDEVESVIAHLQLLLNTRVGEALSAPEFGVLDFADVVHNFPAATPALQQSIRATILANEPRLERVTVQPAPSADSLTLAFEISGRLRGEPRPVKLWTRLTASGQIDVTRRG